MTSSNRERKSIAAVSAWRRKSCRLQDCADASHVARSGADRCLTAAVMRETIYRDTQAAEANLSSVCWWQTRRKTTKTNLSCDFALSRGLYGRAGITAVP
jgi:hypothetical protein